VGPWYEALIHSKEAQVDETPQSPQEQCAGIQELLIDATIAVMEINLKLEAAGRSLPEYN
jgi:hypothetical protein